MPTVTDRIAELGIDIPRTAARPAGTYVPAVRSGNTVYTAGQLPVVDGALPRTGKVGAEVALEDAQALARTAALNALAAIAAEVGSLDRIARVVRVAGFVASDPTFTRQHLVLDGASSLIGEIFGEAGVHARTAVGVAVLPLDSPVEIELVVEISPSTTTDRNPS